MQRLTAQRVNGIKTGYWSAAKKDELIQRLGELEDAAEARGSTAWGGEALVPVYVVAAWPVWRTVRDWAREMRRELSQTDL